MKKQKEIERLQTAYLALVLLFLYLPVAVVIVYSFNASRTDARWAGFTLDWYRKLMHNRALMEALANSLVLALVSSLSAAVVGTLGAVGLARRDFKAKGLLESLSTLPIMIPEIILGMAFLTFFSFLSIPFGMTTLVLAHTTFCIPYIFLVVKGRLAGLDPSIGEAARDLGASEARMFLDVTLPLIAPAVFSGMLLAFAMSLDDVVISFFVTGPATNTLPVKIYSQIRTGVSPEINALCTLMLLSTFLIAGAFGAVSGRSEKIEENQKEE